MNNILHFDNDYMETCHPKILDNLQKICFDKNLGYGCDKITLNAKEKIKLHLNCPEAEIHFLVGGTQTNSIVIDSLLKKYESVISVDIGHITDHEAGAIEAKGHKIVMLKNHDGKMHTKDLINYLATFNADKNNAHMVRPGMVYISFPTEYGTIYTIEELKELRQICDENNLILYMDGARLGYGIAASMDVTLKDIAKYCHVFYIGGTKIGAMFGEALVFTKKNLCPHFFTLIKQGGALLAKGWILGLQFDTLFTDNLYLEISKNAILMANKLESELIKKGYKMFIDSPTNQKFVIIENSKIDILEEKVGFTFWQKYDDNHTVIRIATSWATTEAQLNNLLKLL